MKRPYRFYSVFLVCGFLLACSSTLPKDAASAAFANFLRQPQPLLYYWPSTLIGETRRFGILDLGRSLSDEFKLEAPVLGLMREFISSSGLAGATIASPATLTPSTESHDTPVLYFTSSWELIYQRLPPNIFANQLRLGVIAKVIPFGQVLEGKGPIALRTSAWEGRCTAEAFSGNFFSGEQWAAANGDLLRRGLAELQAECGRKLAREFLAAMRS